MGDDADRDVRPLRDRHEFQRRLALRREDLQAALDDESNPLTIIEGGTFSGNQPLVIPEGRTLTFDLSVQADPDAAPPVEGSTYNGNLSGPGGIIKEGEGDLDLLGNNSYEGGTTVLDGAIDANLFPVSPFGFGPIDVQPGAELDGGEFETFALLNPPRIIVPITDADIEVVDADGSPRGEGWDVIDGKLVIFETDGSGTIQIDGSALQAALDDPTDPLTTIEANTFNGDQPLTIPDGTTLLLDLDSDSTYSGNLSGGGGIEKSGDGDLLLEGDNTYLGGTLLSEGSLTAGNDSSSQPGQPPSGPFGTGPVTVLPDAELIIPEGSNVTNTVTDVIARPDITVTPDGRARGDGWDVINGRLVVSVDPIEIDRRALQNAIDDPVAPLTIIEAETFSGQEPLVLPGDRNLKLDLTGDSEYEGDISGGGGLTKAGPGTLLLSGDNTYSGGTTIEQGTLEAGSSSSEDGTTGPFGTGPIRLGPDGTLDTAGQVVSNDVVLLTDTTSSGGTPGSDGSSAGASGPSIDLSCTDGRRIGERITCTVTGGPEDHEMLWEAAYNPVFATGPVLLGADGTGTFSFVVPSEALGLPITVTLVGWAVSTVLGIAGTVGDADASLVPTRIEAGGGPMPPAPMPAAIMNVLLGTMIAVLVRERRRPRSAGPEDDPSGRRTVLDVDLHRLEALDEDLSAAQETIRRMS
jgi:autotransporter-associated beta strand protein